MAGTSTLQNPELEAETSRARAESIEATQFEEFGGAALRLVGGTEAPAPTSETPPPDRFDLYMRNTAIRFGNLGLVTIRNEIASVRSMRANVIGNDYLSVPFGSDVSMSERLLGVIGCCVVNKENVPNNEENVDQEDEEEVASVDIQRRNEELDSINQEGCGLYFDLMTGSPPQVIEQEIDQFFEKLWGVELAIWQHRDVAHLMIPVSSDTEREEVQKFIKGSLDRKRQLQGAANQLKKIIPIAL